MTEQQRKRSGSDSADYGTELGNFVQRIVTTIKPRLAVEDRGDDGFTLALARGLSENGFGKLITCDSDATRCAQVQQEVAAAGFTALVEVRNQPVLESKIEGNIDLLFSSTNYSSANYEQVVQRFLPQINPFGLLLLHTSEGDYEKAREFALRLDREGILSVVLLPANLKLVMAQKRSGRK